MGAQDLLDRIGATHLNGVSILNPGSAVFHSTFMTGVHEATEVCSLLAFKHALVTQNARLPRQAFCMIARQTAHPPLTCLPMTGKWSHWTPEDHTSHKSLQT